MNKNTEFKNIIENYGKIISSICSKMIMQPEIAEEAAQEAWLEIYKNYHTFKGESKLSTWIHTIAYRVIMNYSKKEKTYSTRFLKEVFSQDEIVYPENMEEKITHEMWTRDLCSKCLTGILHCLNNETRLMYLFRDVSKISYDEIAQIFDKPAASIRKNISRARHKVKNFMENECSLFNKNGKCQCRIKKSVQKIDLKAEFDKIRELNNKISIVKQFDQIMPPKNYREKFY